MFENIFLMHALFLKDLLAASKKSVAAYMGEWDLQALEWGHPKFRQHLLQVNVYMNHDHGTHSSPPLCPIALFI
jgi:hypothetical protein